MTHEHHHAPAQFNRTFALAVALNTGFVSVEGFYGWKVGSLSLLADAGHNLNDVAGLLLAWGGVLDSHVAPNPRHVYSWKSAIILAAFANALLLLRLLAMGSFAWEAIGRFAQPSPPYRGRGGSPSRPSPPSAFSSTVPSPCCSCTGRITISTSAPRSAL